MQTIDVDSIGGNGGMGGFGMGGGSNPLLWLITLGFLKGDNGGLLGGGGNAGAGVLAGEAQAKLDCLAQQHSTLMAQIAKNDTDQNFTTLGLGIDSLGNIQRDATAAVTNQINDLRAQAAECCCENRVAIQGVNTNIAQQTATLQAAGLQNTQNILDKINDNALAVKDSEIRRLQDDLQTQTILAKCAAQAPTNNIDIDVLVRAMQRQGQVA